MGKVQLSLIKKHCRVSIATPSVQTILFITHWDIFKLLFGCLTANFRSFLTGQLHLMLITVFCLCFWPKGHRESCNKIVSLSSAKSLVVSWYEEGSVVTTFKLGTSFNLCPSYMSEGHISVIPVIQTNRKQNASNTEDFEQ